MEDSLFLGCQFSADGSVYGLNAISSKIVTDFFLEIVRLSLKFIRKHRGLRMAKAVLKKNKIGGLKLLDFKTYYQPVIIKTV